MGRKACYAVLLWSHSLNGLAVVSLDELVQDWNDPNEVVEVAEEVLWHWDDVKGVVKVDALQQGGGPQNGRLPLDGAERIGLGSKGGVLLVLIKGIGCG